MEEKSKLNFKLTAHEIRTLLLNSMVTLGIDSTIANKSCLDHSVDEVLEAYMDIDYKEKLKAYNTYWECIREINIFYNIFNFYIDYIIFCLKSFCIKQKD